MGTRNRSLSPKKTLSPISNSGGTARSSLVLQCNMPQVRGAHTPYQGLVLPELPPLMAMAEVAPPARKPRRKGRATGEPGAGKIR